MSEIVLLVGGAMLVAAGVLTVLRIERGPAMLDRTVALDLLVGVVITGLAMWSAATGRTDLVNVLVVLALVGFLGSVTLARFVAVEPEDAGRILSPEEVREDEERAAALEREHRRSAEGRDDVVRRAHAEGEES